jgi:hypothetical protein
MMIAIHATDFDSLKFATLENEWVKVERVDDCRCRILMKDAERMMIGVESGLRSAAEFLNLVADFYDFERHRPRRGVIEPAELPF